MTSRKMICKINGYSVSYFYAGIDNYIVENKNGEYVATCYSYGEIARICGVSLEELKKEIEK